MNSLDERYCIPCKHCEPLGGNGARPYCCMYVVNKKEKRPCPVGVGCTVKELKDRKKRGVGKPFVFRK